MHLPFSGYDFVWLYERCNQIAFLDGHVRAFAHFGGVPPRVIYDNLRPAVKRSLAMSSLESTIIDEHLRALKMPGMRGAYHPLARQAASPADEARRAPHH